MCSFKAGFPKMSDHDDMLRMLCLGMMLNETHWLPVLFLSYLDEPELKDEAIGPTFLRIRKRQREEEEEIRCF